jgi:hypothetical protein
MAPSNSEPPSPASSPKKSKLEKFTQLGVDYKLEFQRNVEILQAAIDNFKSIYSDCNEPSLDLAKFEEKYLIKHRVKEILISVTDDVARYCLYHDIAKDSAGGFALSPPTRAAFFVKWMTSFKPCKLDGYATDSSKSDTDSLSHRFEFTNEILTIFVASTVLGLQDQHGRVCLLSSLLAPAELESLLYQLKYRISHQDVFYSFLNRLYYSNPASENNK